MARERLFLFDTTLRDGAQTNGVDFTLNDKLAIGAMLDDLGIDYVEAGYPGANPLDTALFSERRPWRTRTKSPPVPAKRLSSRPHRCSFPVVGAVSR